MIQTTIKLNVNELCTAVLTEYGAKIINEDMDKYRGWHDRTPFDGKTQLHIPDYKAGDKVTMPLWQIMHTFGGSGKIFMGMKEVPFVDNSLTIG